MEIGAYLRFVATKVEEATAKGDWNEVARLLQVCAGTMIAKAHEIVQSSIPGGTNG